MSSANHACALKPSFVDVVKCHTFTVTIESTEGSGVLQLGATRVHAAAADGAVPLRNRAGCGGVVEASCLLPAMRPPPQLTGSFGRLPSPPRFVSATIDDYDNMDDVRSPS